LGAATGHRPRMCGFASVVLFLPRRLRLLRLIVVNSVTCEGHNCAFVLIAGRVG
jgi:hypothetical protein